MRVPAASLFFSLPLSTALAKQANVYFYPPNADQQHTPQAVDAAQASVLLSHHLGFPIHEELEDEASAESWNNLLLNVVGKSSPKMGSEGQSSVMMVIQSDHPEDFIPSSMTPAFNINDSPPAETFTDLIYAYTERAYQIFDYVLSPLTIKTTQPLLDSFDLASESAQQFKEELNAAVAHIESLETALAAGDDTFGERFAAFEIKSLSKVKEEYGPKSDMYWTAARSVEAFLSNPVLQSQSVAVIVVPKSVAPQPHVHARRAVNDGPRDLPNHNHAVHSVSTCFPSNATCSERTNSCSGRGSCLEVTRAGKSCFTCSCSVTKNEKGRKQWWAGQACEKKDLSSPFTLLAGTTIFLILLIGFAVSILSSVGAEDLPNTLTAAASPHGLKRD